MVNPFLMIAGIGMMATGIGAIIYWKLKTDVKLAYFLYGAALWFIAIIIKFLMDSIITSDVQKWFFEYFGLAGIIVGVGFYYGIRTGILESGISYFVVLKTKLKNMDMNSAFAMGLGFGCAEAFVLGLGSFLIILSFVVSPEILASMTLEQQALLGKQLDISTLAVVPPIIERGCAVIVHLFAMMLVVYSVKKRKIVYFAESFVLKTALDGIVPFLTLTAGTGLVAIYLVEIPVIFFAIVSFFGIKWIMKQKW